MLGDWETLSVLAVIFLATLIRSAFGFGEALIAVPAVTSYYLLSLPLAVAAVFLARVVNQRLQGRPFIVYVHIGLIAVGTALLIQSMWR